MQMEGETLGNRCCNCSEERKSALGRVIIPVRVEEDLTEKTGSKADLGNF